MSRQEKSFDNSWWRGYIRAAAFRARNDKVHESGHESGHSTLQEKAGNRMLLGKEEVAKKKRI